MVKTKMGGRIHGWKSRGVFDIIGNVSGKTFMRKTEKAVELWQRQTTTITTN